MDRLPDIPLLKIFGFIEDYRERVRLERVCRKWRAILLKDGWKHIRRITEMRHANWIEPIGTRCGAHLVECSFWSAGIDSTVIRLITENFPALKHLDFQKCLFRRFDANALERFQEFGARLRSLTFYRTESIQSQEAHHHHLSRHFPRLHHLDLELCENSNILSLPTSFSADLRSLYLHYRPEFRSELAQLMARVPNGSPQLAALYMDAYYWEEQPQQLLRRISKMKNLHIFRISFDSKDNVGWLCSCLDNLPKLIALKMSLPIKQFSYILRFGRSFGRLVHLALTFHFTYSKVNYEPVGQLSTVAPQLRSLSISWLHHTKEITCQLQKIARNGNLEFLNVPCGIFTIEILEQIVRLCPNLHSLGVRLGQDEQPCQITVLRLYAAYQWRTGTRKHLPLRVWIYEPPPVTSYQYRNPFLAIRTVPVDLAPAPAKSVTFVPPNPVLDELFRDKVFTDNNGGGGTPSSLAERYH